jgi:hypothetical protein
LAPSPCVPAPSPCVLERDRFSATGLPYPLSAGWQPPRRRVCGRGGRVSGRTGRERTRWIMGIDDYVNAETGLVSAATAAAVSPRARELFRRGAVYGLAGAMRAGDVVVAAARGAVRGARDGISVEDGGAPATGGDARARSGGSGRSGRSGGSTARRTSSARATGGGRSSGARGGGSASGGRRSGGQSRSAP